MSNKQNITIGLFGFGVVGEGIYKVLHEKPQLQAKVKKVCIKHKDKVRTAPRELFTLDASELLDDPEINVIVELIDDADAALEIVKKAMNQGKAVISANKKMVAENFSELIELQHKTGVSFLYEAAVCGSVPIIRNLEEYFDNDLLKSVSGIVNGSTNFILSQMSQGNKSFGEAVLEAQKLGFAESDPTLDVEGLDAVYKLTIVLYHAFGFLTRPDEIIRKGISKVHPFDMAYAKENQETIKLIANANLCEEDGLSAYVLPSFVKPQNKLFSVENEFNGVLIGSTLADEQFLYGKGAGRFPTSSAVLSDISALRYGYKYEYKKGQNQGLKLNTELKARIYVSFPSELVVNKDDFIHIEEGFVGKERNYLVGLITYKKLIKSEWWSDERVSVILR